MEGIVLELLTTKPSYGLDLVDRAGGRLKRGTAYVTLGRMQSKGYIESWTEPLPDRAIGLPRRFYRPTPFGLRVLDASTLAARAFADRMAR